jgi:hypothetical protein
VGLGRWLGGDRSGKLDHVSNDDELQAALRLLHERPPAPADVLRALDRQAAAAGPGGAAQRQAAWPRPLQALPLRRLVARVATGDG